MAAGDGTRPVGDGAGGTAGGDDSTDGGGRGGLTTRSMLMPRVPISWFGTEGLSTLRDGRLSFVGNKGDTGFDHPCDELHSIATRAGGAGFDVWHGDTRYRIHPLQQRFVVGAGENEFAALGVKVATEKWCEFLVPQVTGSPPPGTKVRRPWPSAAHVLVALFGSFGFIGAIVGIIVALP